MIQHPNQKELNLYTQSSQQLTIEELKHLEEFNEFLDEEFNEFVDEEFNKFVDEILEMKFGKGYEEAKNPVRKALEIEKEQLKSILKMKDQSEKKTHLNDFQNIFKIFSTSDENEEKKIKEMFEELAKNIISETEKKAKNITFLNKIQELIPCFCDLEEDKLITEFKKIINEYHDNEKNIESEIGKLFEEIQQILNNLKPNAKDTIYNFELNYLCDNLNEVFEMFLNKNLFLRSRSNYSKFINYNNNKYHNLNSLYDEYKIKKTIQYSFFSSEFFFFYVITKEKIYTKKKDFTNKQNLLEEFKKFCSSSLILRDDEEKKKFLTEILAGINDKSVEELQLVLNNLKYNSVENLLSAIKRTLNSLSKTEKIDLEENKFKFMTTERYKTIIEDNIKKNITNNNPTVFIVLQNILVFLNEFIEKNFNNVIFINGIPYIFEKSNDELQDKLEEDKLEEDKLEEDKLEEDKLEEERLKKKFIEIQIELHKQMYKPMKMTMSMQMNIKEYSKDVAQTQKKALEALEALEELEELNNQKVDQNNKDKYYAREMQIIKMQQNNTKEKKELQKIK